MRNFLFLMLCSLFFIGLLDAKEYKVRKGLKANIYNDILGGFVDQKMHLSYDTEDDEFLLYVDYMIWPIAIQFTDTLRTTLLTYIQKYKEWNKKATEKGVELEKEIGILPLTKIWFKSGDTWARDNSAEIHTKFFSQSAKKHQLIIYFEILSSVYNEYNTHRPDALYFWWKDVIAFEKAINDRSYQKYIEEIEKKKSIEDEFK